MFALTAIIRTLTKMFSLGPQRGEAYRRHLWKLVYSPLLRMNIQYSRRWIGGLGIYEGLHKYSKYFDHSVVSMCSSSSETRIPSNSLDYLFLDPPFGANLSYSELNFLWESWLDLMTDIKPEAIENKTQSKGANEYRQIMTACFREAYRILKPGRWMTVEFSNTKAAVWNNIQNCAD